MKPLNISIGLATSVAFSASIIAGCAQPDLLPPPEQTTGMTSTGAAGSGGGSSTVSGSSGDNSSTAAGGSSPTGTGGGAGDMVGSGGAQGVGGSATATPDGGTTDSGAPPAMNPAIALDNYRYEYACGTCPTCFSSGNLAQCNTDAICFPYAGETLRIDHFPADDKKGLDFWTMGGDPSKTYEAQIRVRGVMEPKDYVNCAQLTAQKTPDDIYICTDRDVRPLAVATAAGSGFNTYILSVDTPPSAYGLNGNQTHPGHRTEPIDSTFAFRFKGGAHVTFTMDDQNGGEIRNCNYVIPGILNGPNGQRFDGNFFVLNVVGDAKIIP